MASGTVVYGIDLGTTNSCLSRFTDGTFHVVQIDGQDTVPSVVAWDGKDIVVGKRALNQARLTPHQAIRSIKRQMGRPDQVVQLAGKDWTPVEVSSQILAYIRSSAQATLGESIRDVVITVPAWFTDPQRRATVQAGELAGMNVTRIINEPTAAALTFENITVAKQVSVDHCLVYDLGGGTFDVSIVRMVGDVKEVLSSCGNVYLGGDDFDQRLAMRLADHIKETHQIDPTVDLAAMAHLRFLAEDAKIRLSTDVFADLHEFVNVAGKSIELRFRVDREMFNQLISDYIDGTVAKSNEALEQANLKSSDITRLLLVGGSTRIPLVSQKLREAFGLEPEGQIDQDLSVAYGAAIQAALDSGLTCDQVVIDVSPHSLGVAALGEMDLRHPDVAHHGHPLTFVPLVHRNSRLPTKFVERFYTADDDQRKIEIAVYQGESGLTSENILVGSFFVDLPRGMLAGSKIDIGFEYNASGIVQVTVSTPAGDKQLKSYSMDLGRTATVNSELKDDAELDAEYDFLDDEDDDEESKEAASPQVANFLIEKVEKALKGNSGLDYKVVAEQLEAYRQALLKGDDQRLDELEDQLYQWLEDQQASESHPM